MSDDYLPVLAKEFHAHLVNEIKQRPVRGPDGPNGWIYREMLAMLDCINGYRIVCGSTPLTLADVQIAERTACGHSDYTMTYAYHCANLAIYGEIDPA